MSMEECLNYIIGSSLPLPLLFIRIRGSDRSRGTTTVLRDREGDSEADHEIFSLCRVELQYNPPMQGGRTV